MIDRYITDFDKRRITLAGVSDPAVLRKLDAAARKFWRDYDANESKYKDIELTERRSGKLAITLPRRRYDFRGRPARSALRAYITKLVAIYEDATGRPITRIVYSGSDSRIGRQKHHAFLVACLKAVGIHSYPTGLIRQVIDEK